MSAISQALKRGEDAYICSTCATKAGGIWPRDHVATWSVGRCAECKEEKATAALSDWNWPGRKTTLEREL
jgi:hypothetical protein